MLIDYSNRYVLILSMSRVNNPFFISGSIIFHLGFWCVQDPALTYIKHTFLKHDILIHACLQPSLGHHYFETVSGSIHLG